MKTATLPLALLFAALLSTSCTGNEYPEGPFETITLNRGGGYGFCPSEGDALDSRIYRKNERWVMESTVAVRASDGTDPSQCLDEYESNCLVRQERPLVTLTDEQIEALQGAIDAVPAKQCDTDSGLACDPCLVTSIGVDGHDTDGYCCGDLNQDFRTGFRDVAGLIDSFAAGL